MPPRFVLRLLAPDILLSERPEAVLDVADLGVVRLVLPVVDFFVFDFAPVVPEPDRDVEVLDRLVDFFEDDLLVAMSTAFVG